jgi:lipopolysaccharide export system permease protein
LRSNVFKNQSSSDHLLSILFLIVPSFSGEVYRWTDEGGTIHFTDDRSKIPEVIFQWTLPYAVLLATLLTLGTFSRHSEVTAMKAGGVSLYRLTFPLFFHRLFQ